MEESFMTKSSFSLVLYEFLKFAKEIRLTLQNNINLTTLYLSTECFVKTGLTRFSIMISYTLPHMLINCC